MTADTLSMLKYEVTENSLLKYLVTNVDDGQKYNQNTTNDQNG